MSDLSDLFVSYKVVNTPTVTVPKFDDTIVPKAMISQGDMKQKVENIKAKMENSAAFQGWKSSGTASKTTYETPTSTDSSSDYAESTPQLDKGTWKAEMYAAYKRQGCSDLLARNLVGQDALETAWGKSTVGAYNYGNIKDPKNSRGNSVRAHDKAEGSNDYYKSYSSIDDYAKDKVNLVTRQYHITGNETPREFATKLKQGGYATDSHYVDRVVNTIKSV